MTSLTGIAFDFKNEDTSYLTHSLHPYPAKFPPQLPQRIINRFLKDGMSVLDPFCGSGTTLVEARLHDVDSVGTDINGLACLLSKVKSTSLTKEQIQLLDATNDQIVELLFHWTMGCEKGISLPTFDNLHHWFQPNVARELALLKQVISKVPDVDVREFLQIAFASIIVQVSNQESDTRYAAIDKNIQDGYTLKLFLSRCSELREKVIAFSAKMAGRKATVEVHNADARNLAFLKDESFDAIITSPPYANTYDYYLYHKFRKYWLDLDVKYAQYNEIGSRREFSSLKKDPTKWIEDLKKCFSEMARVLKTGGLAFIVIGDSVINRKLLKMDEIIFNFAIEVNFNVCDILTSNLAEHSRVFNPSFTQKGKQEHLMLLQKNNG